MKEHLSEEHYDALREICNVAMGVAGESLAQYTQHFVELSIPKIRVLQPHDFAEQTFGNMGAVDSVSVQLQPFTLSGVKCYALLALSDDSASQLPAVQKNHGKDLSADQLLVDLCHCTAVTCLEQLPRLLEEPITLAPQSLVASSIKTLRFTLPQIASWRDFWAVEINYRLEGSSFNCDLILLFPSEIQAQLKELLDRLLVD